MPSIVQSWLPCQADVDHATKRDDRYITCLIIYNNTTFFNSMIVGTLFMTLLEGESDSTLSLG